MTERPAPEEKVPDDAWQLLAPRFTDERRDKMQAVAGARTAHIRLMVQDIHDPHNISACMRSAEALGILNFDIINLYQKKVPPSVARGAENWLRIRYHDSVADAVQDLKGRGYRIAAGFPPAGADLSLFDVPVDEPIALLFGNEHRGLDPSWLPDIDYRFTIPMAGMVESFNVSVSAAMCLLELTRRSRLLLPENKYFLPPSQREQLLGEWALRQTKRPLETLSRLREQQKSAKS